MNNIDGKKSILLLMSIVFLSPARGQADKRWDVACTGEKDNEWVQSRREALAGESLQVFALHQSGSLSACEAKITDKGEEGTFGSMTFHFKNGALYTATSLPPESSVYTFTFTAGSVSEADATRALKSVTEKAGLHIDWSKPESEKSADRVTKTFWDPDGGTNGRGFLTYKNGHLISIGYGMAL